MKIKRLCSLGLALVMMVSAYAFPVSTQAATAQPCQEHSYRAVTVAATMSENGYKGYLCTVCGNILKTSTIYKIGTVALDGTETDRYGMNVYTVSTSLNMDNPIKPKIMPNTISPEMIVCNSLGKKLTLGTDYTISYSASQTQRKLPGLYSVVVTFKGNYTGTKVLQYKVVPIAVEDVSAYRSIFGRLTVKWDKLPVAGYADGYQIEYSTKRDFSEYLVRMAPGATRDKFVITNFLPDSAFEPIYVRIRAYKYADNGYPLYSDYSDTVIAL